MIGRVGYNISILLLTLLLISCSSMEDKRLDICLQAADSNAEELEKVLKHYEEEPEKLKAARFLLSNMLYNYAYTDGEIDSLKRVLTMAISQQGVLSREIRDKWKGIRYNKAQKELDIRKIKADLLIENIDLAFEVWERRPWSKHYSFEDFCDYILPYRLDNEPLERWRKLYYDRYASALDSLYQGADVVKAAELLHDYIKKEGFVHNRDFTLPHFGALFLWKNRIGYCRDKTDLLCYAMRAAGIPVASDSYFVSNTYVGNHNWVALMDTTGQTIPFEFEQDKDIVRDLIDARKRGKVYRKMYSIQPEKFEGQYEDKELYARFRQPYLKDVTAEYRSVDKLETIIGNIGKEKYAYLSVFDGSKFDPIDVARAGKDKAVFYNVEPDMLYQVTFYRNGEFVPAGEPFWLDGMSSVRYFRPDEQRRITVRLNRKFPDSRVKKYLETAVGVCIEGANRKDFRDAELLCQVVDSPKVNYNIVNLPKAHKYRYIRYKARKGRFLQLGEFAVFSDTVQQNKWIPLRIEADTILPEEEKRKIEAVNDGDWVSFYKSKRKGEALIFDFGQQVPVHSLVYVPRNDDNYVRAGDTYELFYQDGIKGWVSLGKQTATSAWLEYDNVPGDALLWLRNLTRGKEERAFYYEDGRQIFP